MSVNEALQDHLNSGLTTLCRCWSITRADGVRFGFTDHDRDLAFDGFTFRADTGLSALALQQATGLSVDNTEAVGALSDAAVTEADIEAGRFDAADIEAWLVNWAETDQRVLQFRGFLGELRRAGGAFHAELRGLTDLLNRPLGRVYQKPCSAVLGDAQCRFDVETPGYFSARTVEIVDRARVFRWQGFSGFEPGWFKQGHLRVESGDAAGLSGTVKLDYFDGADRVLELWAPLGAKIQPGDSVRVLAGCDKGMETCRLKFNNLLNFQGFPDIPGDDWLAAVPRSDGLNDGGSLRG